MKVFLVVFQGQKSLFLGHCFHPAGNLELGSNYTCFSVYIVVGLLPGRLIVSCNVLAEELLILRLVHFVEIPSLVRWDEYLR